MELFKRVQNLHQASKEENKERFYKLLEEIDLKEKDENGDTALHYACTFSDAFFLQALIEKGAKVEASNNAKYRPLHIAAKNSTAEIIEILLDAGAKMNIRSMHMDGLNLIHEFKSPLYLAIDNKNFDTAKCMIEHGAEVNIVCDTSSNTPLTAACFSNNISIIRLLLENGAIPNGLPYKSHGYFIFPLMQARSAEAVNLLVEAGADIDAQNTDRETALHEIASATSQYGIYCEYHDSEDPGKARKMWQKLTEAMQTLVDLGANPNIKDKNERTAFQVVRDFDMMQILLSSKKYHLDEIGAQLHILAKDMITQSRLDSFAKILQMATKEDVLSFHRTNKYDNDYQKTILHRIFYSMRRYSNIELTASTYFPIIKQIIMLGADVNVRQNLCGYTVLQEAVYASTFSDLPPDEVQVWLDIITLLLEHGADKTINTLAENGATALDMARYESIFDCLSTYGAVLGNYPITLINSLFYRERDSLVKMLISKGVYIKTTSFLRDHAYRHSAYVFELIEPYLSTFGLDLNMPTDEHNATLLHQACKDPRGGPFETVRLLVEQFGLDINAQNNNGDTPLALLLHAISKDSSDKYIKLDDILNAKATALYMLYKGASPDIVNKDEVPALAQMTLKRFASELKIYLKYLQSNEYTKTSKKAKDQTQESLDDINCKLVYKDEKSDKFWKIETKKNQYMVAYGKVDNSPRTQGEVFASTERCIEEANKLISAKKKSGYTESLS